MAVTQQLDTVLVDYGGNQTGLQAHVAPICHESLL